MKSKTSIEFIVLYALLTSLTALSVDAVLPALRSIEVELQIGAPLSTQHIVSLFIFGMVFGSLLFGPLSDAIGRKKALTTGLLIYMGGTALAMFARSGEVMILGRILQGFGAAAPRIATRALIRDQFEGEAMARIMSFVLVLFILVPMVAPALGQFVLTFSGWRAIFAIYMAMAAILCLWIALRQPETLAEQNRIPLHPAKLLRNILLILSDRRVVYLIVATGLIFGAQLLYLSIAADLFSDAYGIIETFPAYFAVLAAGIGIASFVNAQLVGRFGMETMVRLSLAGLSLSGLAMLGASLLTAEHPPFALFMTLGFVAFFCIGILFGNLNAMAMRSLGHMAGLGASLIVSGSGLVAVIFAVVGGAFYNQTTTLLALGFALSGGLSFLLVTFAGKRADGETMQ